jgi:hypothetical protein
VAETSDMSHAALSSSADLPRGDRPARLLALHHSADEAARRNRHIYESMLARSKHVTTGNFVAIGRIDLQLLFDLYDAEFFDGLLGRMLSDDGAHEVVMRTSSRMTRSAGQTVMLRRRVRTSAGVIDQPEYEIAVSTFLLFQNFREATRPVTVGGLACRDRLEALQRTFEHELLHLAEFLAWGRSSCSAANFHMLSRRIFGHEGVTHDLVTPREVAAEAFQIRVGDLVSFEHEGSRRVGRVNRITKRVTVLVEDAGGLPYSDGRRYATYYVPLPFLRKENAP